MDLLNLFDKIIANIPVTDNTMQNEGASIQGKGVSGIAELAELARQSTSSEKGGCGISGISHGLEVFQTQLPTATLEAINDQTKILASDISSSDDLRYWIAMVGQATTPDAVFVILKEFQRMPWTDPQRAEMSHCYVPILEKWYAANPDGWLVDGQSSTPRQRIQIEKARRGWYGQRLFTGKHEQ